MRGAMPVVVAMVVAVALLGCAAGALYDWTAFLRAWLTATLVVGAVPLAAVAVLMTHGLTGGAWGDATRAHWRALAALMPLLALAMLPLAAGVDALFPWTRPPSELAEAVRAKTAYLNTPFLLIRTAVYLTIWLGLAVLLGVWGGRSRAVAAPGLVLWTLTVTFFAIDWIMSLEPEFYSDIFGLIVLTGAAGAGLAAAVLVGADDVEAGIRDDLARLWLAVLIAWLVMVFSQYLLIWSANLPHEIQWYLHRRAAPWRWLGWVAMAAFFVLPVALLLGARPRRDRRVLRIAAGSCLIGHGIGTAWLVLPAFPTWRPAQSWLLPLALVALVTLGWLLVRRRLEPEVSRS